MVWMSYVVKETLISAPVDEVLCVWPTHINGTYATEHTDIHDNETKREKEKVRAENVIDVRYFAGEILEYQAERYQ